MQRSFQQRPKEPSAYVNYDKVPTSKKKNGKSLGRKTAVAHRVAEPPRKRRRNCATSELASGSRQSPTSSSDSESDHTEQGQDEDVVYEESSDESAADDGDSDIEVLEHVKSAADGRKFRKGTFDLNLRYKRLKEQGSLYEPGGPRTGLLIADFSDGREAYPIPVLNHVPDGVPPNMTFRYAPSNRYTKEWYRRYMARCKRAKANNDWMNHPPGCKCKPGQCGPSNPDCYCSWTSDIRIDKNKVTNVEQVVLETTDLQLVECREGVCECNARCQHRFTTPFTAIPVQLINDAQKGYGVFTTRFLQKGMYVGEYTGEVFDLAENGDRDSTFQYSISLSHKDRIFEYVMDARYYGSVCAFFNHSCRPNLTPFAFVRHAAHTRLFPQLGFLALRDVLPGEELTISYGEQYFRTQNMTCRCGYSGCKEPPLRTAAAMERLFAREQRQQRRYERAVRKQRRLLEKESRLLKREEIVID